MYYFKTWEIVYLLLKLFHFQIYKYIDQFETDNFRMAICQTGFVSQLEGNSRYSAAQSCIVMLQIPTKIFCLWKYRISSFTVI